MVGAFYACSVGVQLFSPATRALVLNNFLMVRVPTSGTVLGIGVPTSGTLVSQSVGHFVASFVVFGLPCFDQSDRFELLPGRVDCVFTECAIA